MNYTGPPSFVFLAGTFTGSGPVLTTFHLITSLENTHKPTMTAALITMATMPSRLAYHSIYRGNILTRRVTRSFSKDTTFKNGTDDTYTTSSTLLPPAPTWSIQSLELDQAHAPVSVEQLHVMSKRAVLAISKEDEKELCQDLGNMMYLLDQVESFQDDNEEAIVSVADIYDVPRGVTEAPVRVDDNNSSVESDMQDTWESLLKPKTVRVGAHSYFSAKTKESPNKKQQ